MKANSTQVKIRAAIIVWSLLLIVVGGFSPAAQAQDRNDRYRRGQGWDNYPNYGGSSDLRRTALNAGYNEGMKDGTSARGNSRSSDFRNQSSYRKNIDYNNNNNRDWNRNRNGNRDQDYNRRGRSWDRYDNYGGSGELRQTALNAGYNEGIKEGRNDRNRNRRSDYRNSSAYQKATNDYSSKLGDRSLYQRYYRAGYEN